LRDKTLTLFVSLLNDVQRHEGGLLSKNLRDVCDDNLRLAPVKDDFSRHADDPGPPDRSCGSLGIVVLQGERPVLRDRWIEIGAHRVHPLACHKRLSACRNTVKGIIARSAVRTGNDFPRGPVEVQGEGLVRSGAIVIPDSPNVAAAESRNRIERGVVRGAGALVGTGDLAPGEPIPIENHRVPSGAVVLIAAHGPNLVGRRGVGHSAYCFSCFNDGAPALVSSR